MSIMARIMRALRPGKAARWVAIYTPAFCTLLLLALLAIGGMRDLVGYVMEAGARSVPVMIAIALTYAITSARGLGWNLDNTQRETLQRLLVYGGKHRVGAFLVLAGEMVSILATLALLLLALTVWQG